jgi:phage-related protein
METGNLLRRIEEGESLGMPHSRPMPSIGPRCHEIRVRDENRIWRVVCRLDPDAILIAGVFSTATRRTSKHDIDDCRRVPRRYGEAAREARRGEGG